MYEVILNGESVEGDVILALWDEGSVYFWFRLTNSLKVRTGDWLEILVWISADLNLFTPIECYRSDSGLNYRDY